MNGNWEDIDFKGKNSGQVKVKCPECNHRRSESKKSDTSLSVNLDLGVGKCWYCDTHFFEEDGQNNEFQKITHFEIPPQTWQNYTDLSDKLVKWFADVRGLSQITLEKFHIGEKKAWFGDKEMNAMVFNYFQDGVSVHEAYRSGDKKFSQLPKGKKIPYNLDSLKGQDYAIITEGQIDAMSFDEIGFESVVSVPFGTNSVGVIEEYVRAFDGMKIYLGTDKDYVGAAMEDKLIELFGASRCYRMEYPLGRKDPNEVLVKDGAKALVACVDDAKCVALDGDVLADPEAMTEFAFQYYKGEIKGGLTLGIGQIFDNDVTFREFAYQIIIAKTSIGKSVIGYWVCMKLAQRYGVKFAMLSTENSNALIRHTIIDYYLGDNAKYVGLNDRDKWDKAATWVDKHFFFLNNTAGWGLQESLEKAKAVKDAYGVNFLFIDPINSIPIVKPVQGMTDYSYHQWAAAELMRFSHSELGVITSAHTTTNKGRTGEIPTMYDIEMGGTYINKADLVLVFDRPVDALNIEDRNTTRIWQTKARDRQIYGGNITHLDKPLMLRYTHHGFKFMVKNSNGYQDGQNAHYNNENGEHENN